MPGRDKSLLEYARSIWKELGRSIFEGERYERNMRGIMFGASLIVVFNIVAGCLNLASGYVNTAIASFLFAFAGLLIVYFTRFRQNRTYAVAVAFVAVVANFTYGTLTVAHGFPIFWTLLLPLAFCYLADVKTGIFLSLYFLLLYCVLFLTPLHDVIPVQYPETIVQRFPLLYLADVALTTYIMVQYHLTTLRQMDHSKQLLEAKEAADRANAAKGEFLANMSHEIRTPINAVLGLNEMILRESAQAKELPSEDARSIREAFDNIGVYAGDMRNAGNNLLSIINDILDFSKIEGNRIDIVEKPYRLSSLLSDTVNLVFFRAKEKGLQFVVDVDDTIPDGLRGDEVRVRQIMSNILTNAVKYTDSGTVTFSVHAQADEGIEPGRMLQLVVEVRDTGIGIKPEDAEKLFDKFQRVDMNRNSTIEGTGLGLAITHGLLEKMGGSIQVESVYGEGSVFTVVLPQTISSIEPIGDIRARFEDDVSRATYEEMFRAPKARILIVDDTKMNLIVTVGLLKSTELQIDTASSGEEAIELAEKGTYDLILMDQRMPGMSGTEAMRRIRAQENGLNEDTPVICLTADAVIGARERYLSEGFTDYLSKPIDGEALEQALMKYLPSGLVASAPSENLDAGIGEARLDEGEIDRGIADEYAPLATVGIDPAVGLRHCQGNDLYRTLLVEYANDSHKKMRDIDTFKQMRDWSNLAIVAHAIKSSSKIIGAMELSQLAARIEKAADGGNEDAVETDFPAFMDRYGETVSAIRRLDLPFDEPSLDDDEILEFLPE